MLESFDFLFSKSERVNLITLLHTTENYTTLDICENYTLNAYKRKYLFYRTLHMQAEVVFKHNFTKVTICYLRSFVIKHFAYQLLHLLLHLKLVCTQILQRKVSYCFDHDYNALSVSAELRYH